MIDAETVLTDHIIRGDFIRTFCSTLMTPVGADPLPNVLIDYRKLGVDVSETAAHKLPPAQKAELRKKLSEGFDKLLRESMPVTDRVAYKMYPAGGDGLCKLTMYAFSWLSLMLDKKVLVTNAKMCRMPALPLLKQLVPAEREKQHKAIQEHLMVLCASFTHQWCAKWHGKDNTVWSPGRALIAPAEPSRSDIVAMKHIHDEQMRDPGNPNVTVEI